jgi:hypothetical protein
MLTYVNNIKSRSMASSGMLRRVALIRTEVPEEFSAFFIRVTRIGEEGTALAVTSSPILVTQMKEAPNSSETSALISATRRNIPEDAILHIHGRENLKSYNIKAVNIRVYKILIRPVPAYGQKHRHKHQ